MNERTDSELLRAYAENGSESAFGELVRRHVGLVYSVARRVVVDVHLAEDATQATFAALALEARHLAGRVFLSSWLHRTASNHAAKLVRGEVGPLRRDSQDLARLRAKQQAEQASAEPAQPAPPRDFVPAASWANVGIDRPDAAIQTFFWAGKHGEAELVNNLLRWQRDGDIPASDELDAKFAKAVVSGATRFLGEL